MEIGILILVVIGGWMLFKVVIPGIQMTREQMQDIGRGSSVQGAVLKSRWKHCVNKYKKKGYSEAEAEQLAEQEFEKNPGYFNPY